MCLYLQYIFAKLQKDAFTYNTLQLSTSGGKTPTTLISFHKNYN